MELANSAPKNWSQCPTEILTMIFNHLDLKSVRQSMKVNSRWYAIIKSIITRRNGWHDVVSTNFMDKGASFRTRSSFNCQEIMTNSYLWNYVDSAQPVHSFTYRLSMDVLNIHIYKNKLIVVCPSQVLYYHTISYHLICTKAIECLDYDEQEFIIAMVKKADDSKVLHLRGRSYDKTFQRKIHKMETYKIVDDKCFVALSDGSVLLNVWMNGTWHIVTAARYYGHGKISDIAVCQDEVFMTLNWGGLMKLFSHGLLFIHPNLNIPNFSPTCRTVFNKTVAVIPDPECIILDPDVSTPLRVIANSHMTCVLQHGNVLLVGYMNGRLEVYVPWNNATKTEPNLVMNTQMFAGEKLDDPAVQWIDVHETKGTHHMFVAVRPNKIFKITLVYPQRLKEIIFQ